MVEAYEFGPFRLEPGTRQLLRDGIAVPLTPRSFDVLVALVAERPRAIGKEELLRRVWHDAVVEESNLTQHVFTLRKVLGDTPDNPRFIATVPRRGYRFVGSVRTVAPRPPGALAFTAGAPAPAHPTLHATSIAVAGLLVVALGGLALARINARPASGTPSFHPLTFQHRGVESARFTRDGRQVILAGRWDGGASQLFITPAANAALRPLGVRSARIACATDDAAAVLLDGEAGADHRTLAMVPMSGGAPHRVIDDVQQAACAPGTGQFAIVRRIGGRNRLEYPAGAPLYETAAWIEFVRVSPDGDRVAFLEHPVANDTVGFVSVVDRAGRRRQLSRRWGAVFGLAWMPGGREVAFGHFDGRANALAALDLEGRERDLYRSPDGLIVYDISPDGRALATQFHFEIGIIWQPAGAAAAERLSPFNLTRASALADDGQTLLFTVEDPGATGTYAMYLRRADTAESIPLGEGNAQGLSPDGRWALAISSRQPAHLLLHPTGGGQRLDLPAGPIEQFHRAQWLPDGERVVFSGNERGKGIRIYVQAVSGELPRAISPEGYSLDPDGVSPEGRFVVCAADGGRPLLCSTTTERIDPLPGVQSGEKVVRWSADGRQLYVYQRDRFPLRLSAVDVRTGQRTSWKEIIPPDPGTIRSVPQVLATADGRAFAYNYSHYTSDLYVVDGLR